MPKFFITSSGTGIGKTLITTSLCYQLKNITALKPIVSGYDANDFTNDTAQILMSSGIDPTPEAQARISPWRYRAPLAPNMAAAREGNPVDLDTLVAFCESLTADIALVEGVGGVMAPINENHTVLDWIASLNWPALLVGGNYLGSISHTLTAFHALKVKNIPIQGIIISESADSSVPLDDTIATLQRFIPPTIPLVKIPRIATTDPIWKHTPPISWLCQKPQN